MPEKYDPAYEELKREDFLNKIKRSVPMILFVVFIILLGTGLYTWHDARSEKKLYQTEKAFEKIWEHKKKGQTPSRKDLTALMKMPGMDFVKHMTFAPLMLAYEWERWPHNTSRSIMAFLEINDALKILGASEPKMLPLAMEKMKERIQKFNGPISVWHPFATSYWACHMVKNKEPLQNAFNAFSFLSRAGKIDGNNTLFSKLSSLCEIGLHKDVSKSVKTS